MNRFCKVDPIQFEVGDIVKMQITISAILIHQDRLNMITQLRSMALIKGGFFDVCVI